MKIFRSGQHFARVQSTALSNNASLLKSCTKWLVQKPASASEISLFVCLICCC